MMTGKPAFRYNFLNEEIQLQIANNSFWKRVLDYSNKGFLLGGGSLPKDEIPAKYKWIAGQHAYAILDAFEFDDNRLLLLKDPRGTSDWVGEWSAGSKKWTSRLKEMFCQHFIKTTSKRSRGQPLIMSHSLLNFSVQQTQGTFFMSWEEFIKCFEVLFVSIFFDESWIRLSVFDKWTYKAENSASFSCNCPQSIILYEYGPGHRYLQYLLTVPEYMEIFCLLAHKVPSPYKCIPKIGFEIHKYEGKLIREDGAITKLVAVGRYSAEQRISLNCALDEGKYLVLIATYNPKNSASFIFTVCYPKGKGGCKELEMYKVK